MVNVRVTDCPGKTVLPTDTVLLGSEMRPPPFKEREYPGVQVVVPVFVTVAKAVTGMRFTTKSLATEPGALTVRDALSNEVPGATTTTV